MLGWSFFLLFLVVVWLIATSPVGIEEVNSIASREDLKASPQEIPVWLKRKAVDVGEYYFVRGIFFECNYARSIAVPALEMIIVRIRGHRGHFRAIFHNEVLVEWKMGLLSVKTNRRTDGHEIWVYGHLLSVVKNAVSTNLVSPTVILEHEANVR